MPGLDWLTARPIAHRGLHGDGRLENTLGAAAAALDAKYAIEADLELTADGEIVVFHDETLDRLTGASGPVAKRSLAELKQIAFRESTERIPTLAELLALVQGRTPLVLELKSRWNGDDRIAVRTAAILKDYAGPVAVMSFDPALVIALRALAPGLPRGIVAERHPAHHDGEKLSRAKRFALGNLLHLLNTQPHFVAYAIRDLPALAPLLARFVLGMPLLAWTVRQKEQRRARIWADQMIFEGFRP